MSSEVKVCRGCGAVLVAGENWYLSNVKSGNYLCNVCRNAYQRAYRDSKRQLLPKKPKKTTCIDCGAILAVGDNWYQSSKINWVYLCISCIKTRSSKRYIENIDAIKKREKEYYLKNHDKIKRRVAKYRELHPEWKKKYDSNYRAKNLKYYREYLKNYYRKSRSRKIEAYLKYRAKRAALKQLLVITT